MSRLRFHCFSLLAWPLVACMLLAGVNVSAQANAHASTLPPDGERVLLEVTGNGVQIYACKPPADPAGGAPAWIFVAPEATLVDGSGKEVGSHGAGPMWTLSDGGSVHGKVIAQEPSPGNIPWLLLQAVEPRGQGALATAAYIRRSETRGGAAPAAGCDAPHLGATERVPYSAKYTFYGPSR